MPKRGSLLAYGLTRIILAVPMLLILLTVVFFVLRVLPGNPIYALYGGRAPLSVIDAANKQYGLNLPAYIQYPIYIAQIFTGNFGTSLGEHYRGQSVLAVVMQKLPATIELAIGSMIVATVIGVGMGVLSGINRDKVLDVVGRIYGTVIFVIPVFWLGLMLQYVFAIGLGWFPPNSRFDPPTAILPPQTISGLYTVDALLEGRIDAFIVAVRHLVLPCLTLGLVLSGFFTKTVRANLLRTVGADYVEAARARGLKERTIVSRYAFKNALIPVVTVLGLEFAILFAGAVLTETTFSWDGMGRLLIDSIEVQDYPLIQGTIIVYSLIIVLISIIVDFINGLIDPRIRY
jgi:peptide/nickel transport system permease protein